ncbi:MAG TPA: hypothetical protein VMU87_15760 [Stellaceae bacterium]|nr:hypothetical protein [Stellaceae bacterium]
MGAPPGDSRQPEGSTIAARPEEVGAGSDRFLELFRGAEGDFLAGFDLDGLAGCRIAAHAGGPLPHLEDAEPADADAITALQMFRHQSDEVTENRVGLLFGDLVILGKLRGEMLQRDGGRRFGRSCFAGCHGLSLPWFWRDF